MDARRSVGPAAVAEFELAEMEMLLELRPFGVGRFAILLAGAHRSAPVDEGAVVADEVILEDRKWRNQILEVSEWVLGSTSEPDGRTSPGFCESRDTYFFSPMV
jgi:hypothetical protein